MMDSMIVRGSILGIRLRSCPPRPFFLLRVRPLRPEHLNPHQATGIGISNVTKRRDDGDD